jgi:hypothetical protein
MTFEVLGVIVFLNVMATIALWRAAARKPEKLKKKFISALRDSKPIVPKHKPPKSIGESVPSLVTKEDRLFFDDFQDFAVVVNWWLGDEHVGGPWRLQELPDTDLQIGFRDMPDFGRRYAIFYNQVRLGTLEISPGFHYSTEEPIVRTQIALDWVRLLGFENLHDFLEEIALHVGNPDRGTAEYLQMRTYIDRALTKVLWQTQQITQFGFDGQGYGQLELWLEGSAIWYVERRQALQQHAAA